MITDADVTRIAPDLDIWDAWPIQREDGTPAQINDGATLWMALGAPRFDDSEQRHGHARIYLLSRTNGDWTPLGPVMPDGFSPGSREWSGSAVLDANDRTLTLYFTATGRRGEAELTFEQRLFSAQATLDPATLRFAAWHNLREIAARDPVHYMASDAGVGSVGTIKAFRDPAYFRDPVTADRYLFFAGSRAGTEDPYNGVIGAVRAGAGRSSPWSILPPLIDATGVNNELERPHAIVHNGLYYLFWSTQRHVFAPDYRGGPTGLYGMVSDRLNEGWRPLNGNGLVFANPFAAPRQAYSWLVLPNLSVTSFVDDWGRAGETTGPRRFGATFAPFLCLMLNGDRAGLVN